MNSFTRIINVVGGLLGHPIVVESPDLQKASKPYRGAAYPIRGLPWTAEFIASKQFLTRPEWKRARYDALKAGDGRCQCCGRNKHQLPPGEYLNVDHVKNRRDYPHLALTFSNLEILCGPCNAGRGNRCERDWRDGKARGTA